MSQYVPIRFTDDEASLLQRTFAASNDAKLSTHIKRVYFDAMRPNAVGIARVLAELDKMGATVARLQVTGSGPVGPEAGASNGAKGSHLPEATAGIDALDATGGDPQLMLSILCGVYVMVRKSVGESIRSQADQMLDASAIEAYLRGP